jgi:hypothetical protein
VRCQCGSGVSDATTAPMSAANASKRATPSLSHAASTSRQPAASRSSWVVVGCAGESQEATPLIGGRHPDLAVRQPDAQEHPHHHGNARYPLLRVGQDRDEERIGDDGPSQDGGRLIEALWGRRTGATGAVMVLSSAGRIGGVVTGADYGRLAKMEDPRHSPRRARTAQGPSTPPCPCGGRGTHAGCGMPPATTNSPFFNSCSSSSEPRPGHENGRPCIVAASTGSKLEAFFRPGRGVTGTGFKIRSMAVSAR